MENLLLDYLPTTVMVDGVSYPVDTNFRTFIIFEKILCDDSLEDGEKLSSIINMFYWGDDKPRNIEAAFRKIYELYLCGKEPPKQQRVKKNGNVAIKKQPVFDYEQDAPFIYAAFLAQYGIDLNEVEYLHWWKFQALFNSLDKKSRIVEIMGYRSVDLSQIKNKDERKRLSHLKHLYALPNRLSAEEKVAAAGAAFGGF